MPVPLKIKCQQQDSYKIRDGIPGHGMQDVVDIDEAFGKKYILLGCGCSLPLSYLPGRERESLTAEGWL